MAPQRLNAHPPKTEECDTRKFNDVCLGGVEGCPRDKERSHAEGPERDTKQSEYQPNDKGATHSAAKGPAEFPRVRRLVRHLPECDDAA